MRDYGNKAVYRSDRVDRVMLVLCAVAIVYFAHAFWKALS